MATYPNDATAPITAFSVVATETFNDTGLSRVAFNLPSVVGNKGEVTVFDVGVLQSTAGYSLSNAGATINFATAPNSTQLIVKTITLPSRYRLTRSFPQVSAVDYSNTAPTIVNGNTYIVDGSTESFSFPASVNVISTSDFMVYVSGVFQQPDAFTYPSVDLAYQGIDIGDNNSVNLLTNFASNLTDSSPAAHTITINSGSASFNQSNLVLDATKYLSSPSSNSFHIGQEKSFTFDTVITPDAGSSMSANQTLLSRFQDSSNYYVVRTIGANATVGMIIMKDGSVTEAYGGNCNGGSTYNIAVSYDKQDANLRLYVGNTLVQAVNYNPSVDRFINSPLIIGANAAVAGGSAASQERFKGKIEYIRMADGGRYRSDIIDSPATTATVIGGAPLGALDLHDSLSIRIFDSAVVTPDRFTSMADRKPDSGFTTTKKFQVATFKSQAGYEKRRLQSRRPLRAYDLAYTNITGVEKTAIENFYNARSGDFESFSFDLSHLNESGTITTRFEGDLQISQVLSAGTSLTENFYTVSFKLQETYD